MGSTTVLHPAIKVYTDRQYTCEISSFAYHPALEHGGNIGHSTSNAAETNNKSLEDIHKAATGLEAMMATT